MYDFYMLLQLTHQTSTNSLKRATDVLLSELLVSLPKVRPLSLQ